MSPELENVRREVEQLTRDASEAIWHQAPPGKWSCALIFEHLLLSYTGTTKGISNMIFRDFVYPFELTSFLILVAIMGAVVLAQREKN